MTSGSGAVPVDVSLEDLRDVIAGLYSSHRVENLLARERIVAEVRSLRAALSVAVQRADEAEAANERVRDMCDGWESKAGPGSRAESVYGPQIVSVDFAVKEIRAALSGPVQSETDTTDCGCYGGPHGGYTCPNCSGGTR